MKQNNQNTNTLIMLDSKNPSNVLHYEAHIKLMYQYAVLALAGNVIINVLARSNNENYKSLNP